ncbi:hypothetical protein RB595_007589 [Gaeumannomyces hyphopodioides]
MSVRNATERDIPDLRSILLTGLRSDHVWKYCFPLGQGGAVQLVDDALRLWLDDEAGDDKNRWLVTVSDDPETEKPVSMAVWSLPGSLEDTESGNGGDFVAFQNGLSHAADTARPAADETASIPNPTKHELSSAARLAAVAEAVQLTTRGAAGPLLLRYGPQMVLLLTATHPSHRFRGHARRLAAHGLALAARRQAAVSALAGPMGYIFFSGLRLADCGLVTVAVPGERDELNLKVMVQPAPPGRRSLSQQLLGLFGGGGSSSERGSPALGGRRPSAWEERKRSSVDARKMSAV